MKANEFVKHYGWDKATIALNRCIDEGKGLMVGGVEVSIVDLKRLVESHEVVESCGGLESAKKELQRQSILRWINPETERLRGAIADVESCLEADKKLEGL